MSDRRFRYLLMLLLWPFVTSVATFGDEALGTLTVKGKTTILRYAYVTREADPESADRYYLVLLLTDIKLAPEDRRAERLQALARQERLHALKVRWLYGYDDISSVPYHSQVETSGQVHRDNMILDLRALNEREVKARIRSKMLGQDWHFVARLEARIQQGRPLEAEMEVSADATLPPEAIEQISSAEGNTPDTLALKRELGKMKFEATEEGFDYAVRSGNAQAVRLFLKLSMNPNLKDDRGQHLMMTAATFCSQPPREARNEIVLALLAAGSDVHGGARPAEALTLIWAAQHCSPQVVEAMIAAGADVNARAPGSATPMMTAGFRRDDAGAQVIAILRKAGAKQ